MKRLMFFYLPYITWLIYIAIVGENVWARICCGLLATYFAWLMIDKKFFQPKRDMVAFLRWNVGSTMYVRKTDEIKYVVWIPYKQLCNDILTGVFSSTHDMKQVKEAREELRKVHWTSQKIMSKPINLN